MKKQCVLSDLPECNGGLISQSDLPEKLKNYLLTLKGDNGEAILFYKNIGITYYVLDVIIYDVETFRETAPDELVCYIGHTNDQIE